MSFNRDVYLSLPVEALVDMLEAYIEFEASALADWKYDGILSDRTSLCAMNANSVCTKTLLANAPLL